MIDNYRVTGTLSLTAREAMGVATAVVRSDRPAFDSMSVASTRPSFKIPQGFNFKNNYTKEFLEHSVKKVSPSKKRCLKCVLSPIILHCLGLAMMSSVLGATGCDSCPQCIIIRPICATFSTQFATNNRRGFPSECHMHCYNRCHGTSELLRL
jgi:hypothetical protein